MGYEAYVFAAVIMVILGFSGEGLVDIDQLGDRLDGYIGPLL